MTSMQNTKGLTVFALAMLITGSIDSIRNLPAAALFGEALIFFFLFATIVFLIPTAMVSATLSSSVAEKGGIFAWVNLAFGEKWGFLAIWLQWINTLVWYPTILSFIAGTAAFLIDPTLVKHKGYLITLILGTFWLLTLLNLRGLKTSAKFASFCAILGMIIPVTGIILLAIIWIIMGKPIHLHLTPTNLTPHLTQTSNWISLTAIMTAFLGIELATVHIKDIQQPQKTFPKAMLIAVIIIIITMLMGSLAVAFVLPSSKISLVGGVMQAFTQFFQAYHMSWLTPVLTIMLIIGSLGGMINWIISPARGLLHAAQHGFLPKSLCYKNKHGVASRLLIIQAVLVSLICLAFLLMPSVNGSYWLLTDLSTQLYMLMYILMFSAAIAIKHKYPNQKAGFSIPGKKIGTWVVCLLGLSGCLVTIVVGFLPPKTIDVGGAFHYELIFSLGLLIMLLPAMIFYIYQAKH